MKDTINFTGEVWVNNVCTRGYEDELTQDAYERYYDTNRDFEEIKDALEYGDNEFSLLDDYYKETLKDELLSGKHTFTIEGSTARCSIAVNNTVWVEVTLDLNPDLMINIFDSNDEVKQEDVERFVDELVYRGEADMDVDVELSRLMFEPEVENVERSSIDNNYLTGTVYVNREAVSFDYNVETDEVEFHSYSEPSWITGSSYETELPIEFTNDFSYQDILDACSTAIDDFLEKEKSEPSRDEEER